MHERGIRNLLDAISAGELSVDDGVEALRRLPFENLGWACLDHHRHLRKGFPEVIYGPGKTPDQLVEIVVRMIEADGPVLVTRVSEAQATAVTEATAGVHYHPVPRALSFKGKARRAEPSVRGVVSVVSAGTADLPIAEEACLTLELMGHPFDRSYDIGVAGVHRLLDRVDFLRKSSVIVAVAGMDGALPSLLGGILEVPVIAVPCSVGYGANFQGLAPLLAMLNSCATGVAVVNIDNGFGAGALAAMINSSRLSDEGQGA
jgi:NCAIR mutase (PurE)-related protein